MVKGGGVRGGANLPKGGNVSQVNFTCTVEHYNPPSYGIGILLLGSLSLIWTSSISRGVLGLISRG